MANRTSWTIRALAMLAAAGVMTSCTESPTERRQDGVSLQVVGDGGGGPVDANPGIDVTLALTADPATAAFGEPITVTAVVAAAQTQPSSPTGTVTLYEFGVGQTCDDIGNAASLGSGTAAPYTFTLSSLAPGAHTLTACFVDPTITWQRERATTTVNVGKALATMTVSNATDPDNPLATRLSAIVTAQNPAAGVPTGTVTFYEFVDVGSCADPSGVAPLGNGTLANGTTAISVVLAPGAREITGCYSGDATFDPTFRGTAFDLAPATTDVTLTRSVEKPVTGESVTFTATVTANGTPVTSGSLTYKRGGTDCSTAQAITTVPATSTGFATLQQSFRSFGSPITIWACYTGNATYQDGNTSLKTTVFPAATSTQLFTPAAPTVYGQKATFRSEVSVVAPGGIVDAPNDYSIRLASCAGTILGGSKQSGFMVQQVGETSTLAVGTYSIVACYKPDYDYLSSTGTGTHTVTAAPLKIIAPPSATKIAGTTFRALPTYNGFVLNESQTMAAVMPTLPTCTSAGDAPDAAPGKYTITCSGAVAPNYLIEYVAGELTVQGSTTSVAITPITQQYSDKARVVATVTATTPISGFPLAGKVQFKLDDGAPFDVTVTNGVAAFTTDALLTGSHTVEATFISSNAAYTGNRATWTWIVKPENATIAPVATNPSAINVSQTSVSLGFTVRETNPELSPNPDPNALAAAGNIAFATPLTAKMVGVGSGTSYSGSCTATSTSGTGYSAIRTFTCAFTAPSGGRFVADAYSVLVDIGGEYYTGSYEDVLAVFDPAAGFVSGGGKFIDPADGRRVSFGMSFTATGRGKTGFRGGWVVVKHFDDGSVCRVKSNTMNQPMVNGTTATLTGKSNYACINALGVTTASAGNLDAIGYVEDNGTNSATTPDKFWIRAFGALNMPTSGKANAAPLTGGNITVPKP